MEWLSEVMAFVQNSIHVILHLDAYLNEWIRHFGPWIYAILFAIIFCETGLVVTPFLPGDSLLFALGALCAGEAAALDFATLWVLLIIAAVVGDAVNYSIGLRIGPRIFNSETSFIFNRKHLLKTQAFYEKYGGKTIILARFVPIVRTFAPFVAGVGKMTYSRFGLFNVIGAFLWVTGFLGAGLMFGNLPAVKRNFHLVIVGIIIVSILPGVVEWYRARQTAVTES